MSESSGRPSDSRRELLKKLGVGAGVVWAAPVVEAVAAPSPASAASSPTCTCPTGLSATHTEWRNGNPVFGFGFSVDCEEATAIRFLKPGVNSFFIDKQNTGFQFEVPEATYGPFPSTLEVALVNGVQDVLACGTLTLTLDPGIPGP